MTSLVSCHTQGSAEDGVGSPSFRAPLPCEKRKPKYTSRVPKSTLSLDHYARSKHLLCLQLRSYLLKGCWNNSELLWYTNHLVTKRQKHFQKFSSQTGSRPNASNQLAGVTSLYQTSRLVTRLVKNEMFHSNSYTKSSCNTEQHGNLMFHLQNSSSHRNVLP